MQCEKSFTQSKGLVIHIRSHNGEKPYFCVHCPKSFSCAKTLRLHTRNHTGEKNYHCSQCLKSFTRSSHLRVHMRVIQERNLIVVLIVPSHSVSQQSLFAIWEFILGRNPFLVISVRSPLLGRVIWRST